MMLIKTEKWQKKDNHANLLKKKNHAKKKLKKKNHIYSNPKEEEEEKNKRKHPQVYNELYTVSHPPILTQWRTHCVIIILLPSQTFVLLFLIYYFVGIKKVLLRTFYYISVCLVKIKSSAYFTIQFIFAIIYRSYCTFFILFIDFTILWRNYTVLIMDHVICLLF